MKKILFVLTLFLLLKLSTVSVSASTFDLNDKTLNGNNLVKSQFLNDPSLKAYYKLENLSDSKASNNLTNHNSVTFNSGKFSNSADLGSSNSNKYLSVSSALVPNGNISISTWVKLNSEISADSWIFVSQVSTTNQVAYHLVYDYNGGTRRLRFIRTRNGISDDSISYNISLGTSNWYHLVLTYDGSTMKMYVNGEEKASGNYSGNGNNGATNALVIGAHYSGTGNYASAFIDDVGVFNKPLTATDVSNIYASEGELGTTNNVVTEVTTDLPFTQSTEAINLSGYQYLSASDSPTLSLTSKATIELWVKFNNLPSPGQTMYMVSKRDDAGVDSGYGFGLRNSAGTIQLLGVANESADSSNGDVYKWDWSPTTDTWYHLALTIDSTQVSASTFKLLINGVSQGNGSTITSNNISSIRDAESPFLIGCELQIGATANCVDGKIDDVRIWDLVRTDSEIANNRSIALSGDEPGLMAYYPFEPLLQSKITYYTVNDGTNFNRYTNPVSSGAATQTNNTDGSVTVSVNDASAYTDSGFVLYKGTLGDLPNFTVNGTGDDFGLNIWFDTSGNDEFFAWNGSNILTSLDSDTYGLSSGSDNGTMSVSGGTQFYVMSDGQNHSLSDLKSGNVSGITSSTRVAVWIGVSTSSGSISSTINAISGL